MTGQENIREIFSLGVNFVLYKPVSYERALSSLRAAQSVLYRDKRRKTRAPVHTHATIDYAGGEQAKATLVNLAEEGMAVNFGKRLPPTCKVYFQFQLPGQTANVRLSGQVVWQDWNGRAGIQFVDVPQTSRRVLQEWLKMNAQDSAKGQLASEKLKVESSIRPDEDGVLANARGKKRMPREPTAKRLRGCAMERTIAAGKPVMPAAWEPRFTRREVRYGTTAI